jgi:hypothetical protein
MGNELINTMLSFKMFETLMPQTQKQDDNLTIVKMLSEQNTQLLTAIAALHKSIDDGNQQMLGEFRRSRGTKPDTN